MRPRSPSPPPDGRPVERKPPGIIESLPADHRGNAFVEEVVRGIAMHCQAWVPVHQKNGETRASESDVAGRHGGARRLTTPIRAGRGGRSNRWKRVDIPPGSTEAIGPGDELQPISADRNEPQRRRPAHFSGPGEAGKTTPGGTPAPRLSGRAGSKMTSVKITAWINVEMPAWTPPPSMLPKAKAEWNRWYARAPRARGRRTSNWSTTSSTASPYANDRDDSNAPGQEPLRVQEDRA